MSEPCKSRKQDGPVATILMMLSMFVSGLALGISLAK